MSTGGDTHVKICETAEEAGKHDSEVKKARFDEDYQSDASSAPDDANEPSPNPNIYAIEELPADSVEVDLTHGRLEVVPDLKKFTKLGDLGMRQNMLTSSATFSSHLFDPTTLTALDLYDNQLTVIEGLDACVNLEHLDLSYNRLRKIENLSSLKKLSILYLVHNKIVKISGLDGNTELTLLEMGDNRIRAIENIGHLVKLKALYLGKNKIRKIANIGTLKQLTNLSMQGNRMVSIDNLEELTQLEELYVSDQGLNSATGTEQLVNLTMLDIANNRIDRLPSLKHLTHLEDLWCNDNKLADWANVIETLAPIASLRTVYMEHNPIHKEDRGAYRRKMTLGVPQLTQIDALMTRKGAEGDCIDL